MSLEQSPSDVAESAVEDALVLTAAARELHLPTETLSVTRLAGDASTRNFFRVGHQGGTLVAVRYPWPFSADEGSVARFDRWCADNPEDGAVTFANDPLAHVELTAILARYDVPVPRIEAIADREGIIFVEDVGDELLQAWLFDADAGRRAAAYRRAVDLIAKIRGATDEAHTSGSIAGRIGFDARKLDWELRFFLVNCFDRYLGKPLAPAGADAIHMECRELAEALSERPRFLCHRDYHARNLMVRPGRDLPDALAVIDFQDARMGPLTYDLVSLLEDPYTVVDRDLRNAMIERFADRAFADGVWPGEDAFLEEYDLMSLQRLLKAIGTYANQAAVRGRAEYVPFIAPAAVSALGALDRLNCFPALRRAVVRVQQAARGR